MSTKQGEQREQAQVNQEQEKQGVQEGRAVSQERLEILKKIEEYEKARNFDTDVENDPPAKPLLPDDIDYLRKKLKNRIMRFLALKAADKAINGLIENGQIIIKDVKGAEHISEVKGSAFVTSNHFHIFENMAIYKVFKQNSPKYGFYRVIREGNYTAPPKGFDKFFKYCDTLPLSSNVHTMKKFFEALNVLTKKNNYILIYPEQHMWWNYKKPRPFKDGAFKFAVKYDRPIIPCFITMEDSKTNFDSDGLPVQEYTIHIMKPIYPYKTLSTSEAVKEMKDKNFEICKKVYEETYNKKLEY